MRVAAIDSPPVQHSLRK